jgi:hypothetical protein
MQVRMARGLREGTLKLTKTHRPRVRGFRAETLLDRSERSPMRLDGLPNDRNQVANTGTLASKVPELAVGAGVEPPAYRLRVHLD